MDTYGSSFDDFLHFSNTDTHHHHLPPPLNPPFSHDPNFLFNFPSVLSDEAAELEWLSQFVDDDATSFHDLTAAAAASSASAESNTISFPSSNDNGNERNIQSSSAVTGKSRARKEGPVAGEGGVRRCSHCASEKTPQWRTGPLGPKTLCNACGVRFKSGRLVPEYRPAASPTFVLSQHSNSHRKVMELRRQKELLRQQQQEQQCYSHTQNFQVC